MGLEKLVLSRHSAHVTQKACRSYGVLEGAELCDDDVLPFRIAVGERYNPEFMPLHLISPRAMRIERLQ